ncbi:MAG TPA: hypothetical protein VHU14_06620 [Solirubrobacterales bacterium]|jgi:hypothetical protein|nr:hypothetical protein [Solirubrobacterales bacterium]
MTTKSYLTAEHFHSAAIAAVEQMTPTTAETDEGGEHVVPFELRQWLARLRLLEGVPFAYLVADSALLPLESIRFFHLDRRWTDALVQGALSVGTVNSDDRSQLEQLYATVRAEVDEAERLVRPVGGEGAKAASGSITGFLLRSKAVSGWPGMHVRAYDRELAEGDNAIVPESDARRLHLLRLERLAPAVLLALFDGVPAIVHIEEPRRGIQFGVKLKGAEDGPTSFEPWIPPRDTQEPQREIKDEVSVPCRPGSPGVLDLHHLGRALQGRADTHMAKAPAEPNSAEFALELLRFPYRQVFGDVEKPVEQLDTVFQPTVRIRAVTGEATRSLTERFEEGLR